MNFIHYFFGSSESKINALLIPIDRPPSRVIFSSNNVDSVQMHARTFFGCDLKWCIYREANGLICWYDSSLFLGLNELATRLLKTEIYGTAIIMRRGLGETPYVSLDEDTIQAAMVQPSLRKEPVVLENTTKEIPLLPTTPELPKTEQVEPIAIPDEPEIEVVVTSPKKRSRANKPTGTGEDTLLRRSRRLKK